MTSDEKELLEKLRGRADTGEDFTDTLRIRFQDLIDQEKEERNSKQEDINITAVVNKVQAGNYGDAGRILVKLHYPEFMACSSLPLLVFYFKYFVPWRHKRWGYTEGQMVWRNSLGASITTPAARRTWAICIGVAIVVDKIRIKLMK